MTMTQAEMQEQIIAKAGEDGEFRARLLADPRAAIQEATGEPVPEAVTVQVHEETATSFHLVLPPDGRLSEAEMAHMFAGTSGPNSTTDGPGPSTPGPGQPNSTISI